MTATTMTPAMAMTTTYDFGGADPGTFTNPTSVEPETVVGGPADESSNINRSKDSAIIPPPFGSPESNTPNTGELLTPNISDVTIIYGNNYGDPVMANTGGGNGTEYYPVSSVDPDIPPVVNVSWYDIPVRIKEAGTADMRKINYMICFRIIIFSALTTMIIKDMRINILLTKIN